MVTTVAGIENTAWTTFIPSTSFIPRSAPNCFSSLSRKPLRNCARVASSRPPHRKHRDFVQACAASEGQDETTESPKELSKIEQYLQMIREVTAAETALSNPYGTKMSHEILRLDEDGTDPLDRYVYVEETDCIGCSHCQTTAPGTFFLESDFGRARAFDQTGDTGEVVEEAIDTCPVNCIYYVDWEDLVNLEYMRKDQVINNWSRLVGGQDVTSARKGTRTTKVMDSGKIRCEDCPGRGCTECPLYGVGKNPEYLRKKAAREEKKRNRMQDDRVRRRKRL